MLETAIKAKIPFIAVHTDDPVNVQAILQSIAGQRKLMPMPLTQQGTVGDAYLYWADGTEEDDLKKLLSTSYYKKLAQGATSCVIINPTKHSMLMFDAGVLPTPAKFLIDYLKSIVQPQAMEELLMALRGLSLKTAQEICQLTMAMSGSLLPADVRKTRMTLGGRLPGLQVVDTDYSFYEMPGEIQEWLDLNEKYFLDIHTPQELVPRGLLLKGEPGVGKSMASLVIARHWNVPLFRLDIAGTMDRFLGEAENRIARSMQAIEQNAPCVWLLDEVEKIFTTKGDEGTMERILGSLLWWLQYHKARVVTIMTSNQWQKLPPELYRPGRVDKAIEVPSLTLNQAKPFALRVYQSIIKDSPPSARAKTMRTAVESLNKPSITHSEITELVKVLIKKNQWIENEESPGVIAIDCK